MTDAKPRPWRRLLLIVAAIAMGTPLAYIAIGAVADTLNPSWRNTHKGSVCSLNATVVLVPFSSSQHPGELRVTNRDEATWNNAEVSIHGTIIAGPNNGAETGKYRTTREITPGLTTIPLVDFQSQDGMRWVPSTMRADAVVVSAILRSEKCGFEQSLR